MIRRLLARLLDPQPRPQPTRLAPTLAQLDEGTTLDNDSITTVVVRLADLRACRP